MNKQTEALKLARGALTSDGWKKAGDAIRAIYEALAEQPAQQQEPVAWHHPECEGACIACLIERAVQEAYGSQGLGYLQRHLTSTQPSKPWVHATTWVGLTDEEIIDMADPLDWSRDCAEQFARAIEAKLREKNA